MLINSIAVLNHYGSSFFGETITSGQFNKLLQIKHIIGNVNWKTISVSLRYQYGLMILHMFLSWFGNAEEIEPRMGISSNTISKIRDVISDTLELLRTNDKSFFIPLYKYYLDKFDNQIKYNRLGRQFERNVLSESDQFELVKLAEKFNSYKYPVNYEKIIQFLSQFDNGNNIAAMMNLLRQIKYFPISYLDELIKTAFFSVASESTSYIGTIFGEIGGSTSLMNYLISHSSDTNITFLPTMNDAIKVADKKDPICIFDDCAISGTQSIHTLEEWMGVRKIKPYHTIHCKPVEKINLEKFRNQTIWIFFAVATPYALDRLKKESLRLGLPNMSFYCGTIDDLRVKPFEPSMNYIWKSKDQRDNLKKFLVHIGSSILAERAKRKRWSKEKLIESALGYSDLQRLLIFEHNVPKTTISPLWEQGPLDSGVDWIPLFRGSD